MTLFRTILIYFISFSIIISISSCCQCGDVKLTKVTNNSALTLQFGISTEVTHSNGTRTSSISIVENSSSLNISTTDSVTTNVYLTATDTLSGVKCIELSGQFAGYCQNLLNGNTLSIHGILPNPKECLPLTTCCLIKNRIALQDITQHLRCFTSNRVQSGHIRIYGIAESCSGHIERVFIDLDLTPAEIIY